MKQAHRPSWQQIRQPFIVTALGILILAVIALGLIKNIRHFFSAKQEINQIKNEINRLEKKNREVDNLVDYLNSKEFLEEEARLKFDLRQPNEQIIVVKTAASTSSNDSPAGSVFDLPTIKKTKTAISHNPSLWFKYFFSH